MPEMTAMNDVTRIIDPDVALAHASRLSEGMPMAEPQSKLPGLQIARAVAALTIAYIHSWHVTAPFPPGTSYPIPFANKLPAVELFFAISGFVICLIAVKPNFRPTAIPGSARFSALSALDRYIAGLLVSIGHCTRLTRAQFAGVFRVFPYAAAN
jgi:hypothetical protein